MAELGQKELRGVIDAGARLGAATDLPMLRLAALDAFTSLVDCDLASYNEVAPKGPPLVIVDSGRELEAWEVELMGSLIHQNPMLDHFIRTGDGRARRFSDFLGDRELRRLDLHRELYSRIGANFQLAISARPRAAPSSGSRSTAPTSTSPRPRWRRSSCCVRSWSPPINASPRSTG